MAAKLMEINRSNTLNFSIPANKDGSAKKGFQFGRMGEDKKDNRNSEFDMSDQIIINSNKNFTIDELED